MLLLVVFYTFQRPTRSPRNQNTGQAPEPVISFENEQDCVEELYTELCDLKDCLLFTIKRQRQPKLTKVCKGVFIGCKTITADILAAGEVTARLIRYAFLPPPQQCRTIRRSIAIP
ncbi:hypothetical protein J6590_030599 [Homalodisca vitripennis]|nr:hypothetical protein J6590_030599 [Homalodisca vitripennis]